VKPGRPRLPSIAYPPKRTAFVAVADPPASLELPRDTYSSDEEESDVPPGPPVAVIVAFGEPEDGKRNVVAPPVAPELVACAPIVTVPVFVASMTNSPI
jgi:hypothetical protein